MRAEGAGGTLILLNCQRAEYHHWMMGLYSLFWHREITIMSTIVRYFILILSGCQDALD